MTLFRQFSHRSKNPKENTDVYPKGYPMKAYYEALVELSDNLSKKDNLLGKTAKQSTATRNEPSQGPDGRGQPFLAFARFAKTRLALLPCS